MQSVLALIGTLFENAELLNCVLIPKFITNECLMLMI